MANALELTHYNDKELEEFRSYGRRGRSGASLAAEAISPYSGIVSLLPLVFLIIAGAMLIMGDFTPFFGALLFGSVAVIAVLGWARLVSRREEKREDELWARAASAQAATAAAIDSWLAESYGASIDDYWDSSDLATMALQGKLDPSNIWTLTAAAGGRLEGRFIETAPGVIELRKATVADTDESVYFKSVLAAV